MIDQIVNRFGASSIVRFDPTNLNANESLKKIASITFIIAAFFSLVPFGVYMLFRSSGPISNETSFIRFFMLYAYSMAVFIPAAGLYTLALEYYRVQWVILLGATACTSYFQFKETIDVSKNYLTFENYKRLSASLVATTIVFSLLLKYYFIRI